MRKFAGIFEWEAYDLRANLLRNGSAPTWEEADERVKASLTKGGWNVL